MNISSIIAFLTMILGPLLAYLNPQIQAFLLANSWAGPLIAFLIALLNHFVSPIPPVASVKKLLRMR